MIPNRKFLVKIYFLFAIKKGQRKTEKNPQLNKIYALASTSPYFSGSSSNFLTAYEQIGRIFL